MEIIRRLFGKWPPGGGETRRPDLPVETLREIRFKQLAVAALRKAEAKQKIVNSVQFSVPAGLIITPKDVRHAAEAIQEARFCFRFDSEEEAKARLNYCGLIYKDPLGPTIVEIAFTPVARDRRLTEIIEAARRNYQAIDFCQN